MKNGGKGRLEKMLSQQVSALCDAGPDRMLSRMHRTRIAMGSLAVTCLLMVLLVFVWPAVAPQSAAGGIYQVLAVASLWTFLASMLVLLWDKACRAHRT